MRRIRKARKDDLSRIAEIEIFNYRLNFYPIFKNDKYYFSEMQVLASVQQLLHFPENLENTYVYDDGAVKGFIRVDGEQTKKLFVEPVLQGQGIGGELLKYAVEKCDVNYLWTLEKNTKAIAFYAKHGFVPTGEKVLEEGSTEYLVKLKRER